MDKLSQDLVDRLVCAKYMFRRSCEILARGGPFAGGLAVSGFQDAVELVLRTIVEHLHLSIKETIAFGQIIEEIDSHSPAKVPYRTSLNQLNKARTSFKHFGLEPTIENARKFHKDLDAFFPAVIERFFEVDFESISLINLVGNRRTENFLRAAERFIESEEYGSAARAAAEAFAIYRSRLRREEVRRVDLDPLRRLNGPDMRYLLDNLKKAFESQQERIDVLMEGINPTDFRRFERLTPQVSLSRAGTIVARYPRGRKPVHDRESALFCMRFALDSILLIKEVSISGIPQETKRPNLKISRRTEAVVHPEEPAEVIRYVEVGETFHGHCRNVGGHAVIMIDGDAAYVDKDAVEEIAEEETPIVST